MPPVSSAQNAAARPRAISPSRKTEAPQKDLSDEPGLTAPHRHGAARLRFLADRVRLIGALPSEDRGCTAEVTVGPSRTVKRAPEIERLNDSLRRQLEEGTNEFRNLDIG